MGPSHGQAASPSPTHTARPNPKPSRTPPPPPILSLAEAATGQRRSSNRRRRRRPRVSVQFGQFGAEERGATFLWSGGRKFRTRCTSLHHFTALQVLSFCLFRWDGCQEVPADGRGQEEETLDHRASALQWSSAPQVLGHQ